MSSTVQHLSAEEVAMAWPELLKADVLLFGGTRLPSLATDQIHHLAVDVVRDPDGYTDYVALLRCAVTVAGDPVAMVGAAHWTRDTDGAVDVEPIQLAGTRADAIGTLRIQQRVTRAEQLPEPAWT